MTVQFVTVRMVSIRQKRNAEEMLSISQKFMKLIMCFMLQCRVCLNGVVMYRMDFVVE